MPSRAFPGIAHTTYDPASAVPVLAATIQPKTASDRAAPWITSMVYDAESDRLFMADNFNYKLKVVSMKDPDRVCELKFDNRPRRLALMSGRLLAVTLDHCGQFAVVDIHSPDPKVVRLVKTEKSYRGIVAVDRETLCMTHFNEHNAIEGAHVDCVDVRDGTVTRTVGSAGTLPGLASPDYLAVSPEGTLFISDWSSKRIYCVELSSPGSAVKMLQHDSLGCPCQLCLDDSGNLYVANMRGCGGVMVVSKEGEWRRLLSSGGESYTAAVSIALSPSSMMVSWDSDSSHAHDANSKSVVKVYDMVPRP